MQSFRQAQGVYVSMHSTISCKMRVTRLRKKHTGTSYMGPGTGHVDISLVFLRPVQSLLEAES